MRLDRARVGGVGLRFLHRRLVDGVAMVEQRIEVSLAAAGLLGHLLHQLAALRQAGEGVHRVAPPEGQQRHVLCLGQIAEDLTHGAVREPAAGGVVEVQVLALIGEKGLERSRPVPLGRHPAVQAVELGGDSLQVGRVAHVRRHSREIADDFGAVCDQVLHLVRRQRVEELPHLARRPLCSMALSASWLSPIPTPTRPSRV